MNQVRSAATSEILTEHEIERVGRILSVSMADDPVFTPDLFHTLTGLKAEDCRIGIERWKSHALEDDMAVEVAFGLLNNLVNFPHGKWDWLYKMTGLTQNEARDLNDKLRVLRRQKSLPNY